MLTLLLVISATLAVPLILDLSTSNPPVVSVALLTAPNETLPVTFNFPKPLNVAPDELLSVKLPTLINDVTAVRDTVCAVGPCKLRQSAFSLPVVMVMAPDTVGDAMPVPKVTPSVLELNSCNALKLAVAPVIGSRGFESTT